MKIIGKVVPIPSVDIVLKSGESRVNFSFSMPTEATKNNDIPEIYEGFRRVNLIWQ